MTLREFCELVGQSPVGVPVPECNSVTLAVDAAHPEWWRVYHLTDHVVSTHAGPILWLHPADRSEMVAERRRWGANV